MLILIRKINTRGATRSQSRVSNVVLFAQSLPTSYQETIYRNAQLRYTQILYCTLWEECKQTQCPHRNWRERTTALVWYYSPTKNKLIYQVRANTYNFWLSGQYGKYNSNIFLFHPLGPFLSKKWCAAPEFFVWISSHCSTQIWLMSYGSSWSIYFLLLTIITSYYHWSFLFFNYKL